MSSPLIPFSPFGPGGLHAPSATPDGKGNIISIFNMNPAKETKGWDQIMTLPRRLSILGDDKFERDLLKIEPAGDIESLRTNHQQMRNIPLIANEESVISDLNGNAIGFRKTSAILNEYNFDLRIFEERYNVVTIQGGRLGLMNAR